jgi:hypothetical protein
VRDPQRSHLSLQERELEPEDNIVIIHPNSNHNYENFIVGSYQVGSGFGSYQVRSGRISGHLASDHFGFRVISGQVKSGIRSSSVELFRVSGRIETGRVDYRVI